MTDATKPPVDLTDPARYRCWIDEHVRFADLDPLNHANNNAIGVYFESARLGLHQQVGLLLNTDAYTVVLARSLIDFRAEVTYPNRLRIGVGVLRMGRTSWTYGTGLFVGDRCCATGEAVAVLIDVKTRRPVEPPAFIRDGLVTYAL